MIKNIVVRAINSFMYSVGITVVIQFVLLSCFEGMPPVMQEFGARFSGETVASLTQTMLIGLCSAFFGGGSVIMELEKIGLVVQSILYFMLTAAVWVPVACVCWGIHKYPSALVSVSASYLIAYFISWTVSFKQCKKNVAEINVRLKQMQTETANIYPGGYFAGKEESI